jgi:hypothetical protein
VADIVQDDGIVFDRIEDAEYVGASAIEHLPESDADLLRLLLGDRVPPGELAAASGDRSAIHRKAVTTSARALAVTTMR